MKVEEIPQALIDILDKAAGRKHSRTGSVVRCLAEILTEYDEMPRGKTSKDGDTNVSANGYHYTKVNGKFRLTHHIIAEELLGRPVNTETEVIRFKDKDKTNLSPNNIEVIPKGTASIRARLARVNAMIAEYTAQKELLEKELEQ